MSVEKQGKHGVQSLEIGVQILKAIIDGHSGMMLKEIAGAVGMPASKVHRYLVSMVRTGLVDQERLTSRYDLGSFSLALGLMAQERIDRIKLGLNTIAELCADIDEASALATWTSSGPMVVHWERPKREIAYRVVTGFPLNMITSASGLLFGAYLPPEACAHLIAKDMTSPHLPSEFRSRSAVEKLFAETKRTGLAIIPDHYLFPGVTCIGAPVFNAANQITLTVTVIGIKNVIDTSLEGPVVRAVKASALSLSRRLGYRGGSL